MNWRDVPLPKRMQALGKDKRGYPIPFIVLRDLDGKPHFTVNDSQRQKQARTEGRCGICGSRMKKPFWYVGGPLSAFHEHGAYLDSALDHDCMTYALQVCPYLAVPKYLGRVDDATVNYDKLPEHQILIDPTMNPERPSLFVAVASYSQRIIERPGNFPLVKPERPYVGIEYWRDGQRLSYEEGERLTVAALDAERMIAIRPEAM